MTNSNYELRIISKDQQSDGKVLKKYTIDGQETIGVVENEPFQIEFKNKTWNKIAVRISVDGTDIQTGELAKTSPDGSMWMVDPYGTLNLKAWPESSKGGAEFLFGKTEDSVAANTHGNISAKGIIAAAIFVEGYSPYNYGFGLGQIQITSGRTYGAGGLATVGNYNVFNVQTNNVQTNSASGHSHLAVEDAQLFSSKSLESKTSGYLGISSSDSLNCVEELDNLAVGAGEYVAQEIVKVAGLTQPKLDTTISVKYESWNSLRSKVRAIQKQVINVSNPAFPGDVKLETKMIDLKSTPKGRNKPRKPARTPDLQRF